MLPLHQACTWAEKIKLSLAPFCDQIEIAGSIRRCRPFVNDLDLVLLPKPGQRDAIRARALQRATPIQDGPYNLILRLPNGLQVDLFFAEPRRYPEPDLFATAAGSASVGGAARAAGGPPSPFTTSTWGTILLCRTGSKEHNIKLAQAAQKLGLAWKTTQGICSLTPHGEIAKIIAAETEEEIFQTLGMEWIPPVSREV